MDALVLAPCERSAIWLAKTLAVLVFLVVIELVALPAFAAFFSGIGAETVAAVALANIGICAVGTLTGAMAVAGRARELILPLLFLPLAIPIVVGGVGASAGAGGRYLALPRPLRRAVRSARVGRVRVRRGGDLTGDARARLRLTRVRETLERNRLTALAGWPRPARRGDRADLLLRADRRRPGALAADLLLPRPDRAHGVRLLRLGCMEGAAPPLEAARGGRPRELRRDPPGRDLRLAHARHRVDLGEDLVGRLVGLGRRPARALPRPLPVLRGVLHAALLGRPGARACEHVRRLRSLRGRPDPDLVPRDPALEELHPPRRLHLAAARR